mgnify:CR=1 FL=1
MNDTIRILQLSDTHFLEDGADPEGAAAYNTDEAFDAVFRHIGEHDDLDLIVVTGDVAAVRANLASQTEQVLDARSIGRFTGADPEPRSNCHSGHIPGSANLPYADLIDGETKMFRPADALAARFAASGIAASRPVVTTCGSGVTACVLALGLHLLGRDDVAVYDGSWSEWGTRDDTPVEI